MAVTLVILMAIDMFVLDSRYMNLVLRLGAEIGRRFGF
jgi:hypothetical protein